MPARPLLLHQPSTIVFYLISLKIFKDVPLES
jgi:hypothetical protein